VIIGDVNTWQLWINTVTTIVTFLLVALLQNAQERENLATQHKLNAIADGLAELMVAIHRDPAMTTTVAARLHDSVSELRAAVGLEDRESV
jgi:low affinity Fe/Cu permease